MSTISIWEKMAAHPLPTPFQINYANAHAKTTTAISERSSMTRHTCATLPIVHTQTQTEPQTEEEDRKSCALPRAKMLPVVAACWGNIRCRLATVKSHQQRATTTTMMLC